VDLQRLIRDAPPFHVDPQGRSVLWGSSEDLLRFLDEHTGPTSRTLETGAGLSTVVFAASGAAHTCVTPGADEVERITAYCAERGISTAAVEFRTQASEDVLPHLDPAPLDLVLIDGSHSFPSPFIDWFYTAFRLRVGGHVVIDDVQLWTGRVLERFLDAEPEWELVERQRMRTSIFVKRAPVDGLKDWMDQPYVARRSRPLQAAYTAAVAVQLLRERQLMAFGRKVGRRLTRRA
jgi:predicted O-methyltransferase YrrM